MPDYLVKQPLNYDHKEYGVDDVVNMPAKDAQALLEIDVLEETKQKSNVNPINKPEKPTDETVLYAAIVDAVASLGEADTALWTKDGAKAQVAAIAAVLGYEVSAAERDAAVPPVTEAAVLADTQTGAGE